MADDSRIALVAVVVTGIVGVAGPLITWRATRDVGESSARAELIRGDREDLRRVLDTATSRLGHAEKVYYTIGLRWERATRPLPEKVYRAYRARADPVEFSATQLQIRLGANSPVSKLYSDAWLQLFRLGIHIHERPIRSLVKLENDNAEKFDEDTKQYRTQAHEVAASILK